MDAPTLRLDRYAAPGGGCHIARSRLTAASLDSQHRHDFCEVFWIEAGSGEQIVDGVISALAPGDLVLVRPEDVHGFAARPGGLVMVNLALAPAVVADCERRYFPAGGGPWQGPAATRRHRLAPESLRRLAAQAEQLAQAYGRAPERRALDRLLLDLLDVLEAGAPADPAPEWLRRALAELGADRQRLALGASALTGLSGRSREHVARTVRQTLGTTPSALINRLRLEQAAEDLRMTAQPITSVALDAGYANLGYFYRRFRAAYGCTPQAYRRLHLEPLGG